MLGFGADNGSLADIGFEKCLFDFRGKIPTTKLT
jgi:hypothetical protein